MLTKPRTHAFTLLEMIVLIVICGILLAVIVPALITAREESAKRACKKNLSQIGKVLFAYTSNGEYFPFAWARADMDNGGELPKDSLTSIAEFYPLYLDTSRAFRCPSVDSRPTLLVRIPIDVRNRIPNPDLDSDGVPWDQDDKAAYTQTMAKRDGVEYLYSLRNHTLIDSSYGYDCRMYPSPVGNHAILADMDGSYSSTQNHGGGHNVLYVDGAVQWKTSNYVSNDATDNIFTESGASPGETGWNADTDSYISDNTDPYDPADATPDFTHLEPVDGGFSGRGGSYYADLDPR